MNKPMVLMKSLSNFFFNFAWHQRISAHLYSFKKYICASDPNACSGVPPSNPSLWPLNFLPRNLRIILDCSHFWSYCWKFLLCNIKKWNFFFLPRYPILFDSTSLYQSWKKYIHHQKVCLQKWMSFCWLPPQSRFWTHSKGVCVWGREGERSYCPGVSC